jgi:hypothetical protein
MAVLCKGLNDSELWGFLHPAGFIGEQIFHL